MKIEWEGRAWNVDALDISLAQAMVITGRMGTNLAGWEKALEDPDSGGWLAAMQCLYWLMLQQDGQQVAIAGIDFPVLRFAQAAADAIAAEGAAAPGDPTKPPVPRAEANGEAAPEPVPATG